MGYIHSSATIRRLPLYWKELQRLLAYGYREITSFELACRIGLSASYVRDDLRKMGIEASNRKGYQVNQIYGQFSHLLGMDREFTAVMLGTDFWGCSLVNCGLFNACGFTLLCIQEISLQDDKETLLQLLTQALSKNNADIAIINDRRIASPYVFQRIADSGICGIWNLTDRFILLPEESGVHVENYYVGDGLALLTHTMSGRMPSKLTTQKSSGQKRK